MPIEPWTLLGEKLLFSGYRDVVQRHFRFPDGAEADFDIRLDGQAVAVLAFTKEKQAILVRQFRPGPLALLLEVPGGALEEGEDPAEAAARELLEETGYRGRVEAVARTRENPYTTLLRHNFVALDCEKVAEQDLDPQERIEVELLSLDRLRAHLRSGQLCDVEAGYLGLDHLGWL
jgi:ADP-ribose pyrophosphatase